MYWCSAVYPYPVCFVWVTVMALYRIKPGFDPETADHPGWDVAMNYLIGSFFDIQEEQYSYTKCITTMDANGDTWYLNPDWIVPAVVDLDLTVLGDEI